MKPPPMLLRIGACAGTMTTIGGVIGVVVCAAAAPMDKMTKTGTTKRRCIDALVNASSQYKPKQKPFGKSARGDAALAHRYARVVALRFILRKTRRVMVNARFNLHCNAALSASPVKHAWDTGDVGVQRKVFRVEQMFAERRAHAPARAFRRAPIEQIKTLSELGSRSVSGDELTRELAVVQATIARNRQELAALIGTHEERRMARAAGELGAAVVGMENATQKVL